VCGVRLDIFSTRSRYISDDYETKNLKNIDVHIIIMIQNRISLCEWIGWDFCCWWWQQKKGWWMR
jgi:hypothetical protein